MYIAGMKGCEGDGGVDAKEAGSADPVGEDRHLLVALPAGKSEAVPAGVGGDRRWAYLQLQLWTLWEALTMPAILLPAAFIFMWQAAPDPKGAMFYFYTSYLGFSPEFVGRIKLLEGVAQLLGECELSVDMYLLDRHGMAVWNKRLFLPMQGWSCSTLSCAG